MIRVCRTINVCAVSPVLIIGMLVASSLLDSALVVNVAVLPLVWVFGYLFTLRPISRAIAALKGSSLT